uniref:Secreted peptide n=1 Tax=Anopheles braziliensis TaxID=58242 RepID=A0A2M3ZM11_9DIPT
MNTHNLIHTFLPLILLSLSRAILSKNSNPAARSIVSGGTWNIVSGVASSIFWFGSTYASISSWPLFVSMTTTL